MAINAGPLFRFNPSISFMVNFDPLFFGPLQPGEQEARKAYSSRAWPRCPPRPVHGLASEPLRLR